MNRKERRALQKSKATSSPKAAESSKTLIESMFRLALQHHQAGRLAEAARNYEGVLNLEAGHVDSLQLLGILKHQSGDSDTGLRLLVRAVELDGNNPEIHYNIALIFAALGRMRQSIEHNRRAIDLDSNLIAAYENLAFALLSEGDWGEAFHISVLGLGIKDTDRLKEIFVRTLAKVQFNQISDDISKLVSRALEEVWGRPGDLAGACVSIIKQNKDVAALAQRISVAWPTRFSERTAIGYAEIVPLSSIGLLRQLLTSTPIPDISLERLLTSVRSTLLDWVLGGRSSIDDVPLEFWCALAQQCFLNEYIFDLRDGEEARALELRETLIGALKSDQDFPPLWLAAVGAYFPLHSIPNSSALADRSWPEAVRTVIAQQVLEPQEERKLRPTIPAITAIENEISVAVKEQYEENPYPRWVNTLARNKQTYFDQSVRAIFPRAPYRSLNKGTLDILIAGCGTGCHSIEAAQAYVGADVLAVDLSLTSLSYAKRKALQLGRTNIEFAQADILKLGAIGRTFDLIEASGSLQCLTDPAQGWKALLTLLRPRGVMRVGLYSALARQDVTAARAFIAENGFLPTLDGIRRCRQDIMELADSVLLKKVTKALDFYSASGCRDLIFHAWEHQSTIPEIKKFIAENNLVFLGFEGINEISHQYRRRFPDDEAMINLDHWCDFENENPRLFVEMYQFYLQKGD